jgi:hypothetical protein
MKTGVICGLGYMALGLYEKWGYMRTGVYGTGVYGTGFLWGTGYMTTA